MKRNLYNLGKRALITALIPAAFCVSAQAQDENELKDLLQMDLESMLDLKSVGRGDVGGFGYRLSENQSESVIHGYTTNEFFHYQKDGKPSSFDNHYYNVLLGSNIGSNVVAEIQLEYEHGGKDIDARYAQLDYKFNDAFVIRTGKFLTPINTFNEYLYPEYINKAISRPYINREITPSAWGEVGIQARGKVAASEELDVFYSAFVVNGLEGNEGSGIRGLRGNMQDKNARDKAVGGRLGAAISGLEFGAGVYNGKYTADGQQNLFIGAFDAVYNTERMSIWGEYNMANMQAGDTTINRNGATILFSYLVTDRIEPVLRYDFINLDSGNLDDDRARIYIGANYNFSNTMSFKVGYEIVNSKGTNPADNVLSFQLALGM